jgi:hypothetical protein
VPDVTQLCVKMCKSQETFWPLKTRDLTSHVIAALTGAAIGPQAYQVMSGVPKYCPFCQAPNATHLHVMWTCPTLSATVRNISPCDELQERLGWPGATNPALDAAVLEHMVRVRAAVLDSRRGCCAAFWQLPLFLALGAPLRSIHRLNFKISKASGYINA